MYSTFTGELSFYFVNWLRTTKKNYFECKENNTIVSHTNKISSRRSNGNKMAVKGNDKITD
jgi:hypothetical protein